MAPAEYRDGSHVGVAEVGRGSLAENIFLIPDGRRYILYAPLHQFVAAINGATARLVQQFLANGDAHHIPQEVEKQLRGLKWAQVPVGLAEDPNPDRAFEPCKVTIFPTNQCMMHCVYCYASAGDAPAEGIDLRAAWAAIDMVIANAQRGKQMATVAFHGGCDPLFSPSILKACVGHACAAAERAGVKIQFVISTGGAVSEETAKWLARTFHSVCLSCDGPPDIQDVQRPLANGAPSSPLVTRAAAILREYNVPCGIRATVTQRTAHRMKEMVDYFIDLFGMRQLHFEPVYACGRGSSTSASAPSAAEFIEHFSTAWEHARTRGATLRYSGCRLGWLTERFCSVDGDNFCVTPRGYVTACYEVPDASHPLADIFIFGRFEDKSNSFTFDQKKLASLHGLNVRYKDYCKSCFAKWNCAGDCPVKCLTEHTSNLSEYACQPGARCQINRELTLRALRRALESKGEQSHG